MTRKHWFILLGSVAAIVVIYYVWNHGQTTGATVAATTPISAPAAPAAQ